MSPGSAMARLTLGALALGAPAMGQGLPTLLAQGPAV